MTGTFGIVVNALAILYIIIVLFFSFWPSELPVTPVNMNYSVLITGAAVIFSVLWYLVLGRRDYLGPVIETDMHVSM